MSLASAYATLAASGKYCEPYPVTSITTSGQEGHQDPRPQCKQVISADVAAGVTELLKGVARNSAPAAAWDSDARPAAGKTGHDREAQPDLVRPATPRSSRPWCGSATSSRRARAASSTRSAASASVSTAASARSSAAPSPRPSGPRSCGPRQGDAGQGVPGAFGRDPRGARSRPLPNVIGRERRQRDGPSGGCRLHSLRRRAGRQRASPAGTVAYTDPAGSALPGREVGLYLSTGQVPYVAPGPEPGTGRPGGVEPPEDPRGPRPKRPEPGGASVAASGAPGQRQAASLPAPRAWGRAQRPASTCLTTAATRPPSARPATSPWAAFMTRPICGIPVAPVDATARSTIARSSSSPSCAGR